MGQHKNDLHLSPSAKKQLRRLFLPAFAGFGAGLLCGLLGAGGGIVLLFALQKQHGGENAREDFATALAVTVPLSLAACLRYSAHGSLAADQLAPFVLPALLGGLCGGLLLDRIHLFWLRVLFAALMALSGLILLFR
ncbi:MAG: TSUP family transporter [Clostridia bacterium]|nr:TSUP family transporter [Clostridia bacterium]